jgi:hypothetical protein
LPLDTPFPINKKNRPGELGELSELSELRGHFLNNMPLYGFPQDRRSVVQLIIWLFSHPTKATSLIFLCD